MILYVNSNLTIIIYNVLINIIIISLSLLTTKHLLYEPSKMKNEKKNRLFNKEESHRLFSAYV